MLNRDFKECVASFNTHGVEYLVVGGYESRLGFRELMKQRFPNTCP
jgi:hypothetical protein